jgi:hypothetical protein
MRTSYWKRLNAQMLRLSGVKFETGQYYPYERIVPICFNKVDDRTLKKSGKRPVKAAS